MFGFGQVSVSSARRDTGCGFLHGAGARIRAGGGPVPAWHRWHVAAAPYRVHRYHAVKTHRVVRAHKVYAPRRSHSKVVHSRTTTVVKGRHGGTIKDNDENKSNWPKR